MPERRFFHFTATRADAVLFAALLIAFLLALCARNPLDDSRFAPVHETALSGVVATGEGRGKIDINAADAALLMELDGIGEVLASRIVEYRAQHGPFAHLEDLLEVEGIGPARFQAIKDDIWLLAPDGRAGGRLPGGFASVHFCAILRTGFSHFSRLRGSGKACIICNSTHCFFVGRNFIWPTQMLSR